MTQQLAIKVRSCLIPNQEILSLETLFLEASKSPLQLLTLPLICYGFNKRTAKVFGFKLINGWHNPNITAR